jgi:Kef-type K+ transport system membrane component KefB
MSDPALAALLFVQLIVLLAVCRGLGWIFARVRQPLVVAEMIAGFLLGPSFFGWAAPGVQARLFPPESKHTLFVLSQIGLVLYMFCVGLEFRMDLVARYRRRAIGVSAAGIAMPFLLGGVLAIFMLRTGGFFADAVRPLHAVLFLGAAMSITAFPVLARIISERGIAGTTIGSLSLAAGAMDDAAAWIILAIVLSSFTGNAALAILAAGGAALYVAVVFLGVRRLVAPLAAAAERADAVSAGTYVTVLCLLVSGAWFTDFIGVHSVFGAFVLGASIPRGVLSRDLRRNTEPLTMAILVPLFFVYSGLNTRLTLLDSTTLWMMTAAVFVTACVAKGAACWAAARLSGAPPRHALAIGTLMNARGMVELILANIGLQRGLITPTLFVILVLMAIGTTVMTGPLFSLVWEREGEPAADWLEVRQAGQASPERARPSTSSGRASRRERLP